MKDEEIVKALRCCAKGLGHDDACENCKAGETQNRREYIEFAAANVIERLTAENAALREGASLGKAKRQQKKAYEKSIEFLRALTDGQSDEIKSLRRELEGNDMVIAIAQKEQAKAEAERDALREKVPQWISVEDRLPAELLLVNVVWVNRAPEPYYEKIKDVPFSGTACFYRDRWYWDSPVVLDLLAEYGEDASDLVDDAVEITHWMPLPGAPTEGEKA